MNAQEAFKIRNEIKEHINYFWDKEGRLDLLEDAQIISNWKNAFDENTNNAFDDILKALFGCGQNTCSDTICTIRYKGVYVNVWIHYYIAEIGCPFGFLNDNGVMTIAYANENCETGFEIIQQ